MRCCECNAPVATTALYRVNAKGEIGIWMCRTCLASSPDPVVQKLVEVILTGQPSLK